MAAVLKAARACGAAAWFESAPELLRALVMAMVVARVVSPASKLAIHRMLHDDTATHALGACSVWARCPPSSCMRR